MSFYGKGRGFPRMNHLEDTFMEPSRKICFKKLNPLVKDKKNLTENTGSFINILT